ncbi:MAG: translocation/assembly module TamB domain-containing protein [Desulfuromusa sp.]|nr:translocation/assembly module TamB domain-containing protein [Desulfuromusa sp.]
MVKSWLYTVILISLLILLVFGSASWLLYSPQGTRWLLSQLPTWTGTEISIGRIDGTLGGTLQLDNIELRDKEVQLQLGHLSMDNRLSSLLHLALDIRQLKVERLRIKLTAVQQKKPTGAFHWPKPLWLLSQFRADLSDVEIHDFSWQQPDQEPVQVELFRGNLLWRNSILQGNDFVLKTAALQGSGFFSCGLNLPSVQLDTQIDALEPTASWRQLQLKIDLKAGTGGQILHGSATLGISGTEGKLLAAAAELGLTPEQLQFQQLQLNRPNRSGAITGNGSLQFSGNKPELISHLQLNKLDLQAETGQPVQLSGEVQIKGDLEAYRGQFDLENHAPGPADISLAGDFTGDFEQLTLSNLQGAWLDGILNGQAQIGWQKGWQLRAQLAGQNIDPQKLHPQLAGRLNLDLKADIKANPQEPLQGGVQVQLHDSILHNQPLSGVAQFHWQGTSLQVEQLQLRGDGMLLEASGNFAERLAFHWQIENLEQLLAEATGQFSGNGWLRWHNQKLAAELNADAEELAFQEWQLGNLDLHAKTEDADGLWQLDLAGQLLHNQQLGLDIEQIKVGGQGTLDNHHLTLDLTQQTNSGSASFRGGWDNQQWRGELTTLQGADSRIGHWHLLQAVPIVLSADQLNINLLSLRNDSDSELQLEGSYRPELLQGAAKIHWKALDLSLLSPLLGDWNVSGVSNGSLNIEQGQSSLIHGTITVAGELHHQQLHLTLSNSEILVDWDEQGLRSSLQIELADGCNLTGTVNSPQIANFSWPHQGEVQLSGHGLPLATFAPWVPEELSMTGKVGWNATGSWQIDEPLNLKGEAQIGEGFLNWQEKDEIISANISGTGLTWQWFNHLQGKLDLQLHEQGKVEADVSLPVAARLPLALDSTAPMVSNLHAHLQDLGLLPLFFPGSIQNSHGQLKLNLQLTGSWQQPALRGNLHLFDGEVFLPAVGVQVKEIEIQSNFIENRIEIAKLQLSSGTGELAGKGQLTLQDWYPSAYQLQLKGKNLQLSNLPDLQVYADPDLSIDGTGEKIRVRGQVDLPNIFVIHKQETEQLTNSTDLLVVDKVLPASRQAILKHDIDVLLVLGQRVSLETSGIKAQLGGSLRLLSTANQDFLGKGKIHIIKGQYSGYGITLDINRGNIFFNGGPLDQAALNIVALRKADDVRAGVKVTGTLETPIVQLYSEPVMVKSDILSYIVTGHPINTDSNPDPLVSAVNTLFSQEEAVKLRNQLGLDTIGISSGTEDDDSQFVTAGKYISDKLYLSLGYSPNDNTNKVNVRYKLTPVWELESNIGEESGIDMRYLIEIE